MLDGPCARLDLGHLAEGHRAALLQRDEDLIGDGLGIAAVVARITNADRVTLSSLDGRRYRLGAERHGDHVLHVADHEAVASELRPVGIDVQVVATKCAFGKGARGSRHLAEHGFDLARDLIDLRQILAEHFDANRRADAGRKHVDARLDRHGPGI